MRTYPAIVVMILFVLLMMSCKAKSNDSYPTAPSMMEESAYNKDKADFNVGEESSIGGSNSGSIPDSSSGEQPGEYVDNERKRIKRGSISLIVQDLQKAEKQIENLIAHYGGYTSGSQYSGTYYQIIAKIPAENFNNFLSASAGIGKLNSRNISVEDVTRQFYDLESRIKNKRILLERYQNYLQKAVNTDELLKIERSINDTLTEIENLEGSYKNLSHLISYSTLEINLQPPAAEMVVNRSWPSIKKGFRDLGYTLGVFFYSLFFTVIYIVFFGGPLVLILALFYFLTFGKVGLIRKLFKILSHKVPK